jgi:hypothetical protein
MLTTATQIETLRILQVGERPWDWNEVPSTLAGPWGASPAEAIAQYEKDTGFGVLEYWLVDASLYITTDENRMED